MSGLFGEEDQEEIDRDLLLGDLMKSAIIGCVISVLCYLPLSMHDLFVPHSIFADIGMVLYMPGMLLGMMMGSMLLGIPINTVLYGAVVFVLLKFWRVYAC